MFSPLTVEQMEKIVTLQMKEIQDRLERVWRQSGIDRSSPKMAGKDRL